MDSEEATIITTSSLESSNYVDFLFRFLLLLVLYFCLNEALFAKVGFFLSKIYTADKSHDSPYTATMNRYKSLPGSTTSDTYSSLIRRKNRGIIHKCFVTARKNGLNKIATIAISDMNSRGVFSGKLVHPLRCMLGHMMQDWKLRINEGINFINQIPCNFMSVGFT